MKNYILAAIAFTAMTAGSLTANAQSSLRGLLGFSGGVVNIGADYEAKQDNTFGFGGYFFLQTDEENSVSEVMAIGAFAPVHLLNHSKVDLYIAPGFGILMIDEGNPNGDDATTVGPSLKIGVDCRISRNLKAGIQYMNYYNWLSDKVASGTSHTSVAFTFDL